MVLFITRLLDERLPSQRYPHKKDGKKKEKLAEFVGKKRWVKLYIISHKYRPDTFSTLHFVQTKMGGGLRGFFRNIYMA